jgi:radical SAM protein with 4Fe4S-binding SPASM domain
MDEGLFADVLRQAQGLADDLFFHVLGEPLLHPGLDGFLDLAHERGCSVRLVTNGLLIGRAGETLLGKPALRQVSFSLHALEGSGWERPLASILAFAREGARSGLLISLRLWSQDASGNDGAILEALRREFSFGGEIPGGMPPGRGVRLAPRVFASRMEPFQWPSLDPGLEDENGFCLGLSRQAAVLAGGEVVPCCLDKDGVMSLGNIREKPLGEILSCERARKIIEGFARRRPAEELCRKCRFKRRFDPGRAP